MATYETKQGDTFDSIAYEQLGSEYYMKELIELNFECRLYSVFPNGITLELPNIESSDAVEFDVAPWRR